MGRVPETEDATVGLGMRPFAKKGHRLIPVTAKLYQRNLDGQTQPNLCFLKFSLVDSWRIGFRREDPLGWY